MNIHQIHTENDYKLALKRVESLMDATSGSKEFDELEVLSRLVESYEAKHYNIKAS